jgi:hypothetical protein
MRSELDSILEANWFLVKCKFSNCNDNKLQKIARLYLTKKIQKTLNKIKYKSIQQNPILQK